MTATPKTELTVKFSHPSGPEIKTAAFDVATTGKEAIQGLVTARFLTPEANDALYNLAIERGGKSKQLDLNQSLASQGVVSGDTVKVLAVNTGALPCLA
jgi:hypothetical protein